MPARRYSGRGRSIPAQICERIPQLCFDVAAIVERGHVEPHESAEPERDTDVDIDASAQAEVDTASGDDEACQDMSGCAVTCHA